MNAFRNWSLADVHRYNARTSKIGLVEPAPAADCSLMESKLHDEIAEECRRRGWWFAHGSMAHKTKRTLGEPDFTIVTDHGQAYRLVLFIECKAKTGKLSAEQLAVGAHLMHLKAEYHVVRSFEEFRAVLENYGLWRP